ncbi:MAG: GIY-YIG catalytic domain protein [Parcubacteria group bacterium GW2011_GWB1_40_14]|nr:MAG: GIY-YIG catalytic domain protein [Parcubacteria group bacterium GW2011_GWB1_40_14]
MAYRRSPTPQPRGDSINNMFYVYVLKSKKDGKFYIGSTKDLERRFAEYCKGLVVSTRNRLPIDMVYQESFDTKNKAQKREQYFKGGGRAHLTLKKLIEGA